MRALASDSLVKNESEQGYVMAHHNADRVADWNGQSGERWVAHQARLDARLAVFGQAAIEAAAPATGDRVLDVGCGAGASSLALAARVGAGGQVLGVDISEPLIGRARALAPQDTQALFRVADASSAELPEGAFDILFSRFGVMFFDDPTGAFAQGHRPADRAARSRSARPVLVRRPGAGGAHPDGGRLHRYRYRALRCFHPVRRGRDAAIDDAVEMTFEVGPLSRVLADQPDDIRARASAAVRAAFADRPGERSVMIDGAAWIVTARNPAS
jgi:SAM-dependent methyltransferase